MGVGERADREQMIRPEVRYVEDVRTALEEGEEHAGNAGKDRLRLDQDNVRAGNPQTEQQRAGHERELARQLAADAGTGSGQDPGLHHPDAVELGGHHRPAAMAGMNAPLRVVRQAGQNCDLVAPLTQSPGQAGQTYGGGAGFRRKIVGHDQDAHRRRHPLRGGRCNSRYRIDAR
jgi:hypothetical protein